MPQITRRTFSLLAIATSAASAIPLGGWLMKKGLLPGVAALPKNLNPNDARDARAALDQFGADKEGAAGEVPRSSLSLGDRVQALPLGVWLGIGSVIRGRVSEANYYGYQRCWLVAGSQIVGSGGFYRVVGEIEFAPNPGGVVNATHLLVFTGDRVGQDEALAAIQLPERLMVPRRTVVQIRDVAIDLHANGLRGNWSDDQELLTQRLKEAFRSHGAPDIGFDEVAVIPNTSLG